MTASADRTTGLADVLKERTAEQHRRAETRPLQKALASATIDRTDYARWTVAMHAVHESLERSLQVLLAGRGDLDGLGDLIATNEAHVARLAADAEALGASSGDRPGAAVRGIVADLEDLARETPVALLGSLYVLEGSMNGNRFIARGLAAAWGDAAGCSYLDPYGEAQRTTWQRWRGGLDAIDAHLTDGERDAVLQAAGAMFDAVTALSDEIAAA